MKQDINGAMLAAWCHYKRTMRLDGSNCGPSHMKAFLAGYRSAIAEMVLRGELAA